MELFMLHNDEIDVIAIATSVRKPKTTNLSIRVPDELVKELDALVADPRITISRNNLVSIFIKQGLKKFKDDFKEAPVAPSEPPLSIDESLPVREKVGRLLFNKPDLSTEQHSAFTSVISHVLEFSSADSRKWDDEQKQRAWDYVKEKHEAVLTAIREEMKLRKARRNKSK